MNGCDNATLKRSVLLGARIRFSPSGASVRSQAIERIMEENLAAAEGTEGLTEQELDNLATIGGKRSVLRSFDVKQGIECLKKSGRIVEIKYGKNIRYKLSAEVKAEITRAISEAEGRMKATIQELFGKVSDGEETYSRAFIRLLCEVFSRLSELYVQIVTRKQRDVDLAEHKLLAVVLENVLESESVPDNETFRYGVNRFFRESSPQFDQIKWNMAQNFYVAKALGIDEAANLLSVDIFKGSAMYCDTNILIAGLSTVSRHYNSFRELAKTCKFIGMDLKATHATIEELKRSIIANASDLQKVFDRIPDQTRKKVKNFLLEAYLSERGKSPDLSIDDFVSHFLETIKTLGDSHGLVEEDDQWFDDATDNALTKRLATDLAKQYEEMRRRPKFYKAALHDAVLLLWVAHENNNNRKSWVVTLDMTLSEWNARQNLEDFKIVTLDALLQWMTPLASGTADEDKLAEVFAEAIRYQLLPRDTFFRLSDFRVFAEMGIETRQLPADDVEACIREIKKTGSQLDPSKAEDREKIAKIIQGYFADPGTKYQRTIHELQSKTDDLSLKLENEARLRREAEDNVKLLADQSWDQSEKFRQAENARKAAEIRISNLEQAIEREQQEKHHKDLIRSAIVRTILMVFLLTVIETIIGLVIWYWGEGPNLFQKLTKSWVWLTIGFGAVAIAYPFIMGRERMRLLKWWKGEND
jgi:hypothetical protein